MGEAQVVLAVSSIMDSEMCWSVNSAAKQVRFGAPIVSVEGSCASLLPFCNEFRSIGGAMALRTKAFQSIPSKKACCFSADTPPERKAPSIACQAKVKSFLGLASLLTDTEHGTLRRPESFVPKSHQQDDKKKLKL